MLELDRISRLEMKGFLPFADCDIGFPFIRNRAETDRERSAEVHLITGPNGTGKTRSLAALMAALGNDGPLQERVRDEWKVTIAISRSRSGKLPEKGGWGTMNRWEWIQNEIRRGRGLTPTFDVEEHPLRGLAGTGMALLADAELSPGAEVRTLKASDYLNLSGPAGGETLMQRLLNLRMHVALERDANKPGRHALILKSLEDTVQEITGQEFRLLVRPGKQIRLMAQWDGLELYFSELPDGLRSLLNWLAGWVVSLNEFYPESKDPLNGNFVGLLDEPENHLHPEWQRRVIPGLQKLFKSGQLFIATHSPFVISSLNDGWIHKLSRGSDGKVKIAKAEEASKGDSWVSAVREVLGVKEWFDVETEALLSEFNRLLTRAYRGDAEAEKQMRALGATIMERGVEVANRVGGDMAQFDAARAAAKPSQTVTPSKPRRRLLNVGGVALTSAEPNPIKPRPLSGGTKS